MLITPTQPKTKNAILVAMLLFASFFSVPTVFCATPTPFRAWAAQLPPPILQGVPADITLDCTSAIPAPPVVTANSPTCPANAPAVSYSQVILPATCPGSYVITRTWSATDLCLQTVSQTQIITVRDSKAPVLTPVLPAIVGFSSGDTLIVDCNNPISLKASDMNATDNCDTNPTVTFEDRIKTVGNCAVDGYILKLDCSWFAKDACGNVSRFDIVVLVIDRTAPVLSSMPDNITVSCANVPTTANLTAVDGCDASPDITFSETRTGGVCPIVYDIVRTWKATDDCGNFSTKTQRITVTDTQAPTLENVPNNLTINADNGEAIPDAILLNASDDCNTLTEPVVTLNETQQPDSCGYTISRTWTATDGCGNSSSKVQKIRVFQGCSPTGCTPPVISEVAILHATCGGVGAIQINILGGNLSQYNFTWSPNVSNSFLATGLPAGGYTVTVSRIGSPDCKTTATYIVKNQNGPVAIVGATTPATCDNADGSANISPNIFTYQWSDGGTGSSRNDLKAGTYAVTVVDAMRPTCIGVVGVVIGGGSNLLVAHTVTKKPTCGQDNGSVTLNTTGGSGNYSYSWGSSPIRNNLAAGSYTVTVTDITSGCKKVYTFGLTDDVAGGAIINILAPVKTTCAGNDGKVEFTIIPIGTVALPLLPQIVSSEFEPMVATNGQLTPGNYCINLKDANGCLISSTCFTVTAPTPLLISSLVKNKDCFTDGAIQVLIASGNGLYRFDWSDLAGNNNPQNRADIPVGTYQVSITDGAGCTATLDNILVKNTCDPNVCVPPVVSQATILNAHCGKSDGNISLQINSTQALLYQWSPNVSSTQTASNLASGVYRVTISVVGQASCKSEATYVVENTNGPQAAVQSTVAANCAAADGSATLSPANYNYAWSDNGSGNIRSDLKAGTYQVTVSNPSIPLDCSNILTVVIEQKNTLVVTPVVNKKPFCSFFNGSVTLQVAGGSGNYAFSWGPNATRDSLAGGVYSVTVSDVTSGCKTVALFGLPEVVENGATLTVALVTPPNCLGGNDGNVLIGLTTELNFLGPPTVMIQNAAGTVFQNGSLPAGDYCVVVKNAVGCIAAIECFTMPAPKPLVININTLNKTCAVLGAIIVSTTGGSGAYSYDWADLNANPEPDYRLNLQAGTYSLTVTDAKGCTGVAQNIIILDNCTPNICTPKIDTIRKTTAFNTPTTICVPTTDLCGSAVASVGICGQAANGVLSVQSPDSCVSYQPNSNFVGTDEMCVVICSANGVCDTTILLITTTQAVVICTPPQVNSVIVASHCGKSDGSISLNLNSPTANYIFNWSPNVSSGSNATGLAAGVYKVTIAQASNPNCISERIYTVGNADGLDLRIDSIKAATCTAANGKAVLFPPNFTYEWSDNQTGSTRNNLRAGIYQVTVSAPNDTCKNYLTIEIPSENGNLVVTPIVERKPDCKQSNGQVRLQIAGASGNNYTFSWGNSDTKSNLSAGTYSVTVTETATGCKTITTFALADSVAAGAVVKIDSIRTPSCAGLSNGRVFFTLEKTTGFVEPDEIMLVNAQNQAVSNGNLAPGIYCVIVKNGDGCVAGTACFEIIAAQPLAVNIAVAAQTCTTLGAISVTVSGGVAGYQYDWADLAGTNNPQDRTQLEKGIYALTVSDAKGCTAVANGIVVGNDCPTPNTCTPKIDTIRITSDQTTPLTICIPVNQICDSSLAVVSLCGLPNDGILTTNGLDTCVTYTLNAGITTTSDTMCVVICGANNVCDTTIIIVKITPAIVCPTIFGQDTITLLAPSCDSSARYCLPIMLEDFAKYQITDNGLPYTGGFAGCDFDTTFSYLYFTMPGGGKQGPYNLQAWTVSGQTFNGQFEDVFGLLDSMRVWDSTGNWTIDTITMTFRGGNSSEVYGDLLVKQIGTNGESTQQPNLNLVPMGIAMMLDTGTHKVIVTQIATGCKDTLCAIVTCTACPIVYSGPTTLFAPRCDTTADICINFPFFGDNIGYYYLDDNGLAYTGGFGRCPLDSMKTVVHLDTGYHVFVVANSVTGCRDTFIFTVTCGVKPVSSIIDTTILQGSTIIICLDTTELTAPLATITNICPTSADNVLYTINGNCISIVGTGLGTDTLCLVACGTDGVCDTTTIYVHVLPKAQQTDTLRLNVRLSFADTICVDTSSVGGNIVSITNICPSLSGTNVIFDQIGTSNCFIYTGESTGADTACIVICNAQGICDTTIIIVKVIPPVRDTVLKSVIITQSGTFCVDTTQISPPILTFTNICPNAGDSLVNFVLSTQSPWCVTYTGTALGNDTACLVICNGLTCDTTILIVTVIKDTSQLSMPPVAVNDSLSLSFGQSGMIDILLNDTINGTLVSFDNITMPMHGGIMKTATGFKYTPNENFCGRDSFRYVIQNQVGFDTATVFIDIKCDTFIIFNGLSPNGDGVNDVFTIIGIENYPDNMVVIYNRWGHEIYSKKNYSNADGWGGTWQGGNVPDGTYFYCIGLGPKANDKRYVGYLQIHR